MSRKNSLENVTLRKSNVSGRNNNKMMTALMTTLSISDDEVEEDLYAEIDFKEITMMRKSGASNPHVKNFDFSRGYLSQNNLPRLSRRITNFI